MTSGWGRRPLVRKARADLFGQAFKYSWWSGVVLGEESVSVGGTVRVDPESDLVDGDVVVVPAEGDEVVGVVVAAVGSLGDVVGLEPVAAGASFDRALPLVPPQH